MKPHRSPKRISGILVAAFILFAAAFSLWTVAKPSLTELAKSSTLASRSLDAQPRLVSAEPMAPTDAPMCEWQPAVAGTHAGFIMPVAQQKLTAEQQKNASDIKRRYIPGEDRKSTRLNSSH